MPRAAILSLHRWLALAFAPFLLLQALTGTALILHAAANPPGSSAPASPHVGPLVKGAEQALPGFRVTRLYLSPAPFAELRAPDGQARYAALDPATGRATATGPLWHFPYRAAVQLHYRLGIGRLGMAIVLANGAALAILAISGAAYWWPGRSRMIAALAVRGNLPPRFRLRQWHRTVGMSAAALALYSAATGITLLAPDVLAEPARTGTATVPQIDGPRIDRTVAAAQARFPGAVLRDIRFPPADRLDINFSAPERNPRAVHTVSARPSDGAILMAVPAKDNPVLWMKVLALHTGEQFGPGGMALLLAESGALAFLVWAGLRMWLQARAGKRKAK